MKKAVAAVLLFALLVPFISIAISAEPSSKAESAPALYGTLGENAITYVCQYQQEPGAVVIRGVVDHDVLVTHHEYSMEIYQIAPGDTFDGMLGRGDVKPVASTAISVKFEFSISVDTVADRFSKYAIVLLSPAGERILAAEPQYAEVSSTYTFDASERRAFKGIVSSSASVPGDLGAGTTVLPVDLEQIWSDIPDGYLYPVEQEYRYFDKSYVDNLDAKVRSASATGTRVYLQLVLPATGSRMAMSNGAEAGAVYDMPNVYSTETLASLNAVLEFLASRYESYQTGKLCGVVVGRSIDLYLMNWNGGSALEQYAEQYAYYVTVVANSMRSYCPELDLLIPFSHMDSYTQEFSSEQGYAPSALLEAILRKLDQGCSGGFICGTMIESDQIPLGIRNETRSEISWKEPAAPQGVLTVETLNAYADYLSGLAATYQSAPTHYLYQWTVPVGVSGNALACAYTYAYYRLFGNARLASFLISFETVEAAGADVRPDLNRILRYIDTKDSFAMTEKLLPYFGVQNWQEIVGELSAESLAGRSVYRANTDIVKTDWTGSFAYFEFSDGNVRDWIGGVGCAQLKSDYDGEGVRLLRASVKPDPNSQYAELMYLYEYPENTVYTPFMELEILLSEGSKTSQTLYELVVTFGNQESVVTAEYIVRSGEKTKLLLDMSEYAATHMVTYLKLSTRALDGTQTPYSLNLYSVKGHSAVYDSEKLSELIQAERLRIRNQSEQEEQGTDRRHLSAIIFCVLLAVTVVGVGVLMLIRKNDDKSQKNSE